MKWSHKEEWRSEPGAGFCVTVSRHQVPVVPEWDNSGPFRWCVYGYVNKNHPLYHAIKANDFKMFNAALDDAPLHWGCSYMEREFHKGEECGVKFGADYNHHGDTGYTYLATKDAASEIFSDAEALYKWIEQFAIKHTPVAADSQ